MADIQTEASLHRIVRNFMLLAGLNGLIAGLMSVAGPLFALSLGASTLEIGLVAGVLPLGIGLMSIPVGLAIDRFGACRVFAGGSVLGGLGFFLVSRATTPNELILAIILASPAMPLHFLSIQSDFFHYLPVAGNRKAGWMRAMQMGGSMGLGPLVGGLLISFLEYRTLYVIVGAGFALLWLLARKVLTGPETTAAPSATPVLKQLKIVFSHREIIETSLISLASYGATAFYGAFILIIAIEQFGVSEEAATPLLAAQGLSYIGALLFLGGVLEIWGRRRYYRTAYSTAVLGLWLLGWAKALPALFLGAVLLGLGLGMVAVANVVRQAAVSGQLGRGNVSGAANPPAAFGAVAGSLIGGALGDWLGLQNVFFVFIASFALLSWFELSQRTRKRIQDGLAVSVEHAVLLFRRLGLWAVSAARKLAEKTA